MRDWFWAWLIAAAAIAIISAATRDRVAAPWAVGCAAAAGLEALRTDPWWQWGAFLVVSSTVFLALNRKPRHVGRHVKGRTGR